MSLLFSPLRIGGVVLPNRIAVAPMCQYSAVEGRAGDWHLQHLGGLAQSGAGLLIIEATAVEPRGRITHADLGLWDAGCATALARVLRALRRYSSMPLGIQLAHAGRKASCARPWEGGRPIPAGQPQGWSTLAPSPSPFHPTAPAPQAASEDDLEAVVAAFAASARRAVRLGLDLIELHAAHGYLLHQFLSPLSNQRDDAYGGSLENRMRLTLRVFDAVRAVVPVSCALGVRISATDWVEGGWDETQSAALAAALQLRGCDYLHVSSGGLSPAQQIPDLPHYQVGFAARLRTGLSMPVMAVGRITEPLLAEEILQRGQADAVALGRGLLFDPRWPWRAAAALGERAVASPQYLRCAPANAPELFQ